MTSHPSPFCDITACPLPSRVTSRPSRPPSPMTSRPLASSLTSAAPRPGLLQAALGEVAVEPGVGDEAREGGGGGAREGQAHGHGLHRPRLRAQQQRGQDQPHRRPTQPHRRSPNRRTAGPPLARGSRFRFRGAASVAAAAILASGSEALLTGASEFACAASSLAVPSAGRNPAVQ